ncbi:MAG: amidophosphoribosyltransferase [Chloroflexaceae bacterium]|nr:amidophosphoribosyltransferase [Chloroflexaceae bacterium]
MNSFQQIDHDGPHEECGVFGVYAPGLDVARLTFFALYALQHRGQESSGIATCDGRMTYIHKGMGLVSQVFNEGNLSPLEGHLAIGQNRYSTTGSSLLRNAQPYLIETFYGPLGVAHNGNLTNAWHLRQALLERGVGLFTTTDSEVVTQMLASPPEVWAGTEMEPPARRLERTNGATGGGNGGYPDLAIPSDSSHGSRRSDHWEAHIRAFMRVAQGAYSLTILTRDAIYGVRDPYGLRPLCLGELEEGGGYVVASESCALQTVGARYLREVEPGEIVRLDRQGITSTIGHPPKRRSLCIFEFVYFARPDSVLEGQVVHETRQRLGRQLAREAPAEADVVVGVPDSATPAAIGYSLESGLAFTEGLIKNRYIGRTFIQPDDHLRKVGVRLKYNPLTANLKGKRVVLIDDSIVRGNTVGPMVQLLRDGGATEVHVRVSSPPVRNPCFMGVDMATYEELVAYRLDVEEIRQWIGADSLAYLSLEGMLLVIDGSPVPNESRHCHACFSGCYPLPIPDWLFSNNRDKMMFETVLPAKG